jgi:predicted Kef-type K+ transport protein
MMFGYSLESSFFASTAMVPIGEISILLASYGVDLGILSKDFLGIISAIVMVSSITSFPLLVAHKRIGEKFEIIFRRLKRFS